MMSPTEERLELESSFAIMLLYFNGIFSFDVFLSVSLPHGAMGWSGICNCALAQSDQHLCYLLSGMHHC